MASSLQRSLPAVKLAQCKKGSETRKVYRIVKLLGQLIEKYKSGTYTESKQMWLTNVFEHRISEKASITKVTLCEIFKQKPQKQADILDYLSWL